MLDSCLVVEYYIYDMCFVFFVHVRCCRRRDRRAVVVSRMRMYMCGRVWSVRVTTCFVHVVALS